MMRATRALCAGLAVASLLAACATTPGPAADASLFHDELFAASTERIAPEDVFALSPEMRAYLDSEHDARRRDKELHSGLFYVLLTQGKPWLSYDATMTRNASEAFAARSGNCLSLVIMTAAFARELGMGVRYQSVYTQEAWTRGQGLDYLNGHVNVALLNPIWATAGELLIDFVPVSKTEQVRHSIVVEEKTIVAMYMNNRAVELLAGGELDRAYWWAKAANRQDDRFLGAINTLAVVYRARRKLEDSERALRFILGIEPDNIVALDNLVLVLQDQGRDSEADALATRLRKLQPIPPFHFYDLGIAALKQGDYGKAKEMLQKEMRRDANYSLFHASLALAYHGLGRATDAQEQMAIAVQRSTTNADRATYALMLARLRAGEHP
jgi:Tfp pilus assembly protein PilF/predicted small secreted protein